MVHISLVLFVVQTVQFLHFGNHAQRAGGKNLRLSSRKDAAAVNAGQNAVFAPDGTNIGQTSAVRANAFVDDARANLFFGQIVQRIVDFAFHIGIFFGKVRENVFRDGVLLCLATLTIEIRQRFVQHRGSVCADVFIQIFGNVVEIHFALGFAHRFCDLFDKGAFLFDGFVSEQDSADHFVVRNFLRAGFYHHDGVFGTREVEV